MYVFTRTPVGRMHGLQSPSARNSSVNNTQRVRDRIRDAPLFAGGLHAINEIVSPTRSARSAQALC
jgi:hypothetical protein